MKLHRLDSTRQKTIVSFSLLLLTVTGGVIWWMWQAGLPNLLNQAVVLTKTERVLAPLQPQKSPSRSQKAVVPNLTVQPVSPTSASIKQLQPEIYRLKIDQHRIILVPQPIALNHSVSPEQALMEGVIHLLSNPQMGHQSSAIPAGTHLLSLQSTPKEIHVNLSHEFGAGGGSTSMVYRVAQILYTVTSLNPNAKVYLAIEGQPLDEDHPLGGEGLILQQPLTRQQFAKDFSLD